MRKGLPAAVFLASGCAPAALPPPPAAIAANADDHDRTVEALTLGSRASAERDFKGLEKAQRLLSLAGARPDGEGPDLAASWRSEASRLSGWTVTAPPPMRGRVLGSAYRKTTLAGGETLKLEQIFMAGQKARVSIVPGDGSPLSFSVSEKDGSALCTRSVAGAAASCAWLPTWTTRYRIEVRNQARKAELVYLVIK